MSTKGLQALVGIAVLFLFASIGLSADKPPVNPRPARPDDSDRAIVARQLDSTLRVSAPQTYAGTILDADGAFTVFVTAMTPDVSRAVQVAAQAVGGRV